MTGHGALNYDGNLNVSGYDGWAFAHDAEKRLLSVTGNGHSAQFAHDGLGRCVKRTIDGLTTVFTYDNWKPVAEWTGTGTAVAWNLYGAGADEILVRFQQTPEGYLHYHLDPMGNVQFLLSDHPDPGLEKYTYDVFGKPTIIGWNGDVRPISNHGNRFLFRGREYLYTFGLYDYRRRIYHPGLGRFIQTDPLGLQIEAAKLSAEQRALYFGGTAPEKFNSSEFNLYRYCHNDPVNQSDPFGLDTTVVWVDEGNRNQHETVVVKNKTEYTALTEPGLYVTVSGADANGDVVATVHHVINVRYSDDVGPKNKELQKKEPDHARELDKWRDERGKPATDILARHDGPLQGKTPEQVKEMVDHRLRDSFNNAVKETKKHDVPGDHILKGANRHD